MRVTHLIEEAKKPRPKEHPDVGVGFLKKMPNREFIGEILAPNMGELWNKYRKALEEGAFFIVECATCKKHYRVVLNKTFLFQVSDAWGDETDAWINKWVRVRLYYASAKAKKKDSPWRSLELFDSNPRTSTPADSVSEPEVLPPSDATATVPPSPSAMTHPVKTRELSDGPTWLKDQWNAITTDPIPQVLQLNDVRIRACQKAIKAHGLDDLAKAIHKVEQSDFCRGQGEKGWSASFDWFLEAGNALKALEGSYDNPPPRRSKRTVAMQRAMKEFLEK